MYVLTPAQKAYAWGSTHAIQDFSGIGTPGEPLAEIWYGAHAAGPSTLADGRGLDELIASDAGTLGSDVAARFAGELPFLVKLLAPGRAVSLQVHPSAERAREAYAQQLADDDSERAFVDANHKPEQIFALTPFEGLVGLRPIDDAIDILARFELPLVSEALAALRSGTEGAISTAITILAGASAPDVESIVARARELAAQEKSSAAITAVELAEQYPGDAGVAVSLMLERVRLQPGDSVMVHSGVPHAYMSGLALEVMANSDNVFRLGLTQKKVDVEESVANLITSPALVNRPHGSTQHDGPAEFELAVHPVGAAGVTISGEGPRIAISIAGTCRVGSDDSHVDLSPGRAVFLPHGSSATVSAGEPARLAVISVPASSEGI